MKSLISLTICLPNYWTKFFLLFIIYHLSFNISSAQNSQINRTNHWYFGDKAGIDFTSGTAIADTNGQMGVFTGCAAISDTAGNLLMYTNGTTVWNRQHNIMPNGTGLLGLGTPVQSSVIVPKPMDDDIYYVFTNAAVTDGSQDGMRYSIVDMTLQAGLGDVTVKNQLLFQPSTEQLGATMHANCTDVWIMGHERNSNKYRAYLLTSTGIDTNNVVINDIGYFPTLPNTDGTGIKFSYNGKKMAAGNFWDHWNTGIFDTLDLYDFDNNSGFLSNRITIPDTAIGGHFGFSPDDSKLYYNSGDFDSFTYQLDISSNNQATILSTRFLIYYDEFWNQTDFQATPDNKLLVAVGTWDTIPVINSPNSAGLASNFVEKGLSLNDKQCMNSFPNFVSSYYNQDSTFGCFVTNINEIKDKNYFISVYPNPFKVATNINIESEINQPYNIDIALYDLLGKKLNVDFSQNFNQITLNRGNLNTGIYLLQLTIQNRIYTKKLIIN